MSNGTRNFDKCGHKTVGIKNAAYDFAYLNCPRTDEAFMFRSGSSAAHAAEGLRKAAAVSLCGGCALAGMSPEQLLAVQAKETLARAELHRAKAEELKARAELAEIEAELHQTYPALRNVDPEQ